MLRLLLARPNNMGEIQQLGKNRVNLPSTQVDTGSIRAKNMKMQKLTIFKAVFGEPAYPAFKRRLTLWKVCEEPIYCVDLLQTVVEAQF